MDFMDYSMIILNQGLYQMRTINSIPNWAANEGESLLYSSGGIRRCYYYIDGAWRYTQWGSGTSLSGISDSDYDTIVDTETYPDEDIIRFTTAGTQRMVIDLNGVQLVADYPLILDGVGGDTYWKFVSSTSYLTGYVDGNKRIEL